uniref:Immune-type receptor 9 n=1 Tax=Sphoeroides nephelus TaxID=39110 RepID=Q9IB03_9TELE|nr:immune-type receptor 9 [Sphoeroides nephelus]
MALTFLFYLAYFVAGKMASDVSTVLKAGEDKDFRVPVGKNFTFECFFNSGVTAKYYWYKEAMGDLPKLVSSFYTFEATGKFWSEFESPRFVLDAERDRNHLTILSLQPSDTATYYCASSFSEELIFNEGITLIVEGSGLNIPVLVHRPGQPEGGVPLNCTAHGASIDEDNRVYRLESSGKLDPGVLYTLKDNTCFHSLPSNSLAVDCAVATCGHFLLGAKTEAETQEENLMLVCFLSIALVFTTILAVFLAGLLCRFWKSRSGGKRTGFRTPASPIRNAESHGDEDVLHYAALQSSKPRRPMKDANEECVYSRVKHHQ